MSTKTDPNPAAPSRRKGIQSVEVGLRVLEALVSLGEASTLRAIAQASGMSGSQAHRYLSSLITTGMAQQDSLSGRYDLGPAALQLGLGALARIDAFKITDSAISEFVGRTGWTVQIAAFGPMGPTVVRWHMGRPAVMTSFNVGSVLPLLFSATGQVFLGFTAEAETALLLDREMAESDMSRAEVDALRARIRSDGHAAVEGALVPGLNAVAYPIFDIQSRPILCATALSTQAWKRRDRDASLADLAATCVMISKRLGWPQG
jgi:DNA-binding IclR family transcriptional regulator